MGGLGYVIGGALSGLGAGLAKQAEMDWQQRRDMALEGLRAQREQSNIAAQGQQQRITQEREADLNDRNAARATARQTTSTITIDKNRSTLDTARQERIAKVESQLRRTDAAAAEALKRASAAGEVSDTFQDDQGNWYAIMKDGSPKPLNVKGTVKKSTQSPLEMGIPATTGPARLNDDAAADAFVSNPANAGKTFIGPDGKQYRVPGK